MHAFDFANVVEGAIYVFLYNADAVVVDVDILPQFLTVVIMLMFAMFVLFKLKLLLLMTLFMSL